MARETFKDVGDDELFDRLTQTKDDLFKLRFQHVTGQLDNTSKLGQLRKDVARLNTELREREISAAEALASEEKG